MFDQVCAKHKVEHRLTKPAHPQTNGMVVERFNGRISEIVKTTYFSSAKELEETMINPFEDL